MRLFISQNIHVQTKCDRMHQRKIKAVPMYPFMGHIWAVIVIFCFKYLYIYVN